MRKLYREGEIGEVWGIKCEWKDFHDDDVDTLIADGWVLTPLDLVQKDDDAQGAPKKRSRQRKVEE